MLRRDKLVVSETVDGDYITYHPSLAPNVRITFENDPNFEGLSSNYVENVSFSDGHYDLKGIQTSIIGSYNRLSDTAPNIHSIVTIKERWLIGYTIETYLLSDETIESLYFYNSDYSLQESLTKQKTITNSNFILVDGDGSGLDLGTHEYYLSKTTIDIKDNLQIPIRLHLDMDFSDDCQYIRVTTIDPQVGQDQYNFEVLPNGQNDAGKYLYTIRWWGYFKEPYRTSKENMCLAFFDPSLQTTDEFNQSNMYSVLTKDTEHAQAEMSCIMVTIPPIAKSFDFTTTVECDTPLYMAKYKDILTYTDVTVNEDGTITPITV